MTDLAPTERIAASELRNFGLLFGAAFALLLGIAVPLMRGRHLQLWPWIVAGVFWLIAVLMPESLRMFHASWMRFGHLLGTIQSRILLALVFFLIVTPMGLVRRMATRRRDAQPNNETYRLPSRQRAPGTMERPF